MCINTLFSYRPYNLSKIKELNEIIVENRFRVIRKEGLHEGLIMAYKFHNASAIRFM